ncbi:MAG: exodeoxyribonuclease III [Eubacteriales bacterium]|nr:exodeoxyribonuclease III [Eubacteriales bacterium]
MKLISWNVNGIRAAMKKGFLDFVKAESPDILCVQETKMQEGQAEVPTDGYHQYWFSAEKKGYSGTAVFTKEEPISVSYGLKKDEHDKEGRTITCEYGDFYLVNVYVPNAQPELKRIDYRMSWEDAFRDYVKGLEKSKPVVICGDMNVAHEEIDLKNPKTNRGNAGFSDEERGKMTELLGAGFIDTWRYFNPDLPGVYSWWSYRSNARVNNAGWRIDYFLTSKALEDRLVSVDILTEVMGSDHCPVMLEIK